MRTFTLSILIISIEIFMTCNLNAQTTLEEYNYVTKGYKVQVESGLDMKKGYEIEDVDKISTSERKAELKVLYRIKNGTKEIAAYMIIYSRDFRDTEYICIPNPKSEKDIMDNYWTQLYNGASFSSERLQLIAYLISCHMKW